MYLYYYGDDKLEVRNKHTGNLLFTYHQKEDLSIWTVTTDGNKVYIGLEDGSVEVLEKSQE